MFTAETDVLPNTTQEAKHGKNNNVLNMNLTCGLEALAVSCLSQWQLCIFDLWMEFLFIVQLLKLKNSLDASCILVIKFPTFTLPLKTLRVNSFHSDALPPPI